MKIIFLFLLGKSISAEDDSEAKPLPDTDLVLDEMNIDDMLATPNKRRNKSTKGIVKLFQSSLYV